VSGYPGGPARGGNRSRPGAVTPSGATGGIATTGSASVAGRSSVAAGAVPAGSVAADSTAQQRRGVSGMRSVFGQCSAQQMAARISATRARGAATAMRAVIPTARIVTQAVSRFRDTERHCMSGVVD
jgi:hypothetical protein